MTAVSSVSQPVKPIRQGRSNGSSRRSQANIGKVPSAYGSVELWRSSPEHHELFSGGWGRNAAARLLYGWLLLMAVAASLPFSIDIQRDTVLRNFIAMLQVLFTLAALTLFINIGFRYGAMRRGFYDRVRLEKAKAVEQAVERLREKLSVENLFVLNRRQLDEYHVMSVRQQHVSFRNAQVAAAVGFIILIAGVILSLRQPHDPSGRYITAGLSALGTLLSGFISGVFFKSYADTSEQLRQYYQEPFRTGQILTIERVARLAQPELGADSDTAKLRCLIVEELLKQLGRDLVTEPAGKPSK